MHHFKNNLHSGTVEMDSKIIELEWLDVSKYHVMQS